MAITLFPSLLPSTTREFASDPGEWDSCPGCDEYDDDHVAQHARNAHPEIYSELTSEDSGSEA